MNQQRRDFDKEAANWDENAGRVKMARNVGASVLNAVKVRSDMDVLDFGCGTGLITLQLQPLVRCITGVDSSVGMLQVLANKIQEQQLHNVKPVHLDVEQGELLSGSYNLIVSSMTLHHIRDIKSLLGQFYDVMQPGGYLCLADLDPDEGHFHGINNNQGVFHFGFERKSLGRLIELAGFNEVEFSTAAEVVRFYSGGLRPFSIFLVNARKALVGAQFN